MMKMFIVDIGYQKYALALEDAGKLTKIFSRMKPVKQANGYSGPYIVQDENEHPIDGMTCGEVIEREPVKVIPESHQITDQTTRALPAPEEELF